MVLKRKGISKRLRLPIKSLETAFENRNLPQNSRIQMLKILLFPFSVLYDVVTRLRNHLYDRGLKPSVGFDLPVISIGNLSVGGTGKTPMTEYLIRLLSSEYEVGTLSRGYGRSTK